MTSDTAVRGVDDEVAVASALCASDARFPNFPYGLSIPARAMLEYWFADRFIDPAVVEGISSLRELDSITSRWYLDYEEFNVTVGILLWGGNELLRSAKESGSAKTATLGASVVIAAMQSDMRMEKDIDALEIGAVIGLCGDVIPMNALTVGELAFVVARERRWLFSNPMNRRLDGVSRSILMGDRTALVSRLREVSRTDEALMWAVMVERCIDSDYLPEADTATVDSFARLASLCSYDEAAPYLAAGVRDFDAVYRAVTDGIDVQLLISLSAGEV